jgi:palmitoyltransferase ZDHHC6
LDTNESPIHDSSIIDKSSPWTYKNNSLNPNLQSSNSESRRRNGSQTFIPGASSLPPYHPDYRPEDAGVYNPGNDEGDESSDEQDPTSRGHLHIRKGSEGYEIRPEAREEMLKRYMTELGEVPGRYIRYIPQPESEENTSEDDIPLGRRRERIRQQ